MSAFCDPATTTSRPHSSCLTGTAPSPDTASTTISAPCRVGHLGQRADVVDDAGGRLGKGREDRRDVAAGLGERRGRARRARRASPTPRRGARGRRRRRRTARPSARRTSRTTRPPRARPGRVRFATADSIAPAPGRREAEHVVPGLEDVRGSRSRTARVDLDEGRRAVVEDRLRHHLRDARRERRGPRCHQVLLDEGVGHRRRPRIAETPAAAPAWIAEGGRRARCCYRPL